MMRHNPPSGYSMLILCGLMTAASASSSLSLTPVWSAEVAASVLQAEQQRIAAIAKAIPASIAVFSTDGNGGGSGVVVTADGYALSNFHVTAPVGDYLQCGMPDGKLYDAVIVGIDPTGDVALIKLLGRDDFPVAELGDSDQVRVGDWCFAVGNPFLLATNFQPTVSYGLVSGVHRYQYPAGTLLEYADCIQTDAAINPGNSGGPLFNDRGQLIGINGRGSFEKRGRVNVGLGYAISINQIKHFMGSLRSGRIVDHATLGATVVSDGQGRVIVSNILESSDAYRRGLRYGDEVIAFGGREIGSVNGFKNVLGIYPQGWRVSLSFLREGQRYDIQVRLAGVHGKGQLIEMVQKEAQAPPDDRPDGEPPKKRPPGPPGPDRQPPKPPEPERQGPERQGPERQGPERQGGEAPPDFAPESPHLPAKPVPAEAAALIQKRPGYANYYFNLLNRKRVWNGLLRGGDFKPLTGEWQFKGQTADGQAVVFTLGEMESIADYGNRRSRLTTTSDLSEQLDPPGSGGLLAALHCWRKFLILGPESFGEVYYVGTRPLPGRPALFDVLSGTHNVVELQFSFDSRSGQLVSLEMSPDVAVDPCEIFFDDYREIDGRQWPHRMTVRYGDQTFAELRFEAIQATAAPKDNET
jgi:serine protease Do